MANPRKTARPDRPRLTSLRGLVQLSFRDPAGQIFQSGDRILRSVVPEAREDLEKAMTSSVLRRYQQEGKVVGAKWQDNRWLEHPRVEFPSYPYEWSSEMLAAAGRLTLDLALELVDEGLGLKDASSYNVLFDGPKAVFVDWLSFERRRPGDRYWLPFSQFKRHFVSPLALQRHKGLPIGDLLLRHRDGLDPLEVFALLGKFERWLPPFLGLATLPVLLAKRFQTSAYQPKIDSNPEKASFIFRSVLKGLRRELRRMEPTTGRESKWSGYLAPATFHYTSEQFAAKEKFVMTSIAKAKRVLDIGANTGHFSFLAARAGASVVAIDSDEPCVGAVWKRACEEKLDVLPLVVDLSRPTPAVGWRNRECASFLERASGRFDAVLMLAVVHHLVATERVPLEEIVDLAASLTHDRVIIEYVPPSDPQFQSLARGRDYSFFSEQAFEAAFAARFTRKDRLRLSEGGRVMYQFRAKR